LTGLALKSIPPEVYDLIVIISLNVDSNDLNELDHNLSRLILLQELSCKCNKLEKLPEIVFELSALTILDMSFNSLTTVVSGPFRQLKNLRELNLANNSLVSLPDEIGQLASLEVLSVESNLLKKLPELGSLKSLTTLIAYDNKLQAAPRNLPASLETIDLSRNDLTSLSGSNVCCIPSLKTLDLSSNRLVELPRFRAHRLEELAVADNRLESLSPLEDLPELRVLDASRNALRALPFSIGALSQLSEVHLRNNYLEALPPSLGMCQHLRMLDVSDNKLESVPEELGLIPSLTHLKLRHNSLNWVPAKLSHLPHLQELDLVNNRRIANLPAEMTREDTPARAVLRYLSTLMPELPAQQQPQLQQQQPQPSSLQVDPQQQLATLEALEEVPTPNSSYRTPRLARRDVVPEEKPSEVQEDLPVQKSWIPEWVLPAAAGAGFVMIVSYWLALRKQSRR
jgi:Leucine-rich repeat (LRR) protein